MRSGSTPALARTGLSLTAGSLEEVPAFKQLLQKEQKRIRSECETYGRCMHTHTHTHVQTADYREAHRGHLHAPARKQTCMTDVLCVVVLNLRLHTGEYEARLRELEGERQAVEEDRQQVRVCVCVCVSLVCP